jgi:hypothetical protein
MLSPPALGATAAGNEHGCRTTLAHSEPEHGRAYLLHRPYELVAQDRSWGELGNLAVEEVQI